MGALSFDVSSREPNVETAFWNCVREALAEHGNDGYTGTIAEKYEFEIFHPPRGVSAEQFAEDLRRASWEEPVDLSRYETPEAFASAAAVYDYKWGPAVAIPEADGGWRFCGQASS